MKPLLFLFIISIAISACHSSSPKPNVYQAVIDEYFKQFNDHNWKKMSDLYAQSIEVKDPAYGQGILMYNKDSIVKKYVELEKMIPDVHDSVVAIYNAGDEVVVEFVSSGTGPDQQKFSLPICTIFGFKDGFIVKDFTYYDNF